MLNSCKYSTACSQYELSCSMSSLTLALTTPTLEVRRDFQYSKKQCILDSFSSMTSFTFEVMHVLQWNGLCSRLALFQSWRHACFAFNRFTLVTGLLINFTAWFFRASCMTPGSKTCLLKEKQMWRKCTPAPCSEPDVLQITSQTIFLFPMEIT